MGQPWKEEKFGRIRRITREWKGMPRRKDLPTKCQRMAKDAIEFICKLTKIDN